MSGTITLTADGAVTTNHLYVTIEAGSVAISGESIAAVGAGYTSGVLYRLTPTGPAYATEAETVAAIIAETVKQPGDVGGRPLPLAGSWHIASTRLAYQLGKIADGWPLLPWFYCNPDYTVSELTTSAYGGADDLSGLETAGLPFTMLSTQFDSALYLLAPFVSATNADTGMTPLTRDITTATANGTSTVTLVSSYADTYWEGNWQAWQERPVTISGMTGGWAALNGAHTAQAASSTSITITIDGSGYGSYAGGASMAYQSPRISPLGTTTIWTDLGAYWADATAINHVQAEYPSPPRMIWLSNNESPSLTPNGAYLDTRYEPVYGAGASAGDKSGHFHYEWIEKYNTFKASLAATLTAGYASAFSMVGYNAFLGKRFRDISYWWQYDSGVVSNDLDRVSWTWHAWDGGSPEVYDNPEGTIPAYKTPYRAWGQGNEAMVFRFGRDVAESVNPDYWFEISVWDGDLWPGATRDDVSKGVTQYRANRGITPSPEYYKGWVQYSTWITQPRCLREFRDGAGAVDDIPGTDYNNYWQKIMDICAHVHQEPTLRRFWRSGTLVENPNLIGSFSHPFQANDTSAGDEFNGAAWNAYPRNYHLPTNLDSSFTGSSPIDVTLASANNIEYPVWTLAYLLGTEPNREWLIYAHSASDNEATLEDVEVTVPGLGATTLPEVPAGGAFYYFKEAA